MIGMMGLLQVNQTPLATAALRYAALGWPILPLLPHKKQPATMNGLSDASHNSEKVSEWWNRNPDYNIGIVTGIAFDALDLDGEAGVKAFGRLAPEYKHSGPVQGTGKGYHLLFQPAGSSNHARIGGDPIDYRGARGYIVVAPSVHPEGHRYQWVKDGDLPEIPAFLRPLLFPQVKVRKTGDQPDFIKELLEKEKDIVAIFQEMGYEPKHWGSKMYLHCPFHQGDNTPSLVLYPKTNSFFCYGCLEYGDPLNVRQWINTGKLR